MGPPAGEEELPVSECTGDREGVFALPLARAAADQHERQRPAEPRERLGVRSEQERQPLDRREAADVEQDRLRLLNRPQVAVLVGDAAGNAALVPAERLLDQPPAPVGEPLDLAERPTPEEVELDTARELDHRSARECEEARDLGARTWRDDQPLAGACPPAHALMPAL